MEYEFNRGRGDVVARSRPEDASLSFYQVSVLIVGLQPCRAGGAVVSGGRKVKDNEGTPSLWEENSVSVTSS